MNKYSNHQFVKFHRAFWERTFDQDDVAFFLMAARDYSRNETVFRELGDFLAHPKQKDRGMVLKQVEQIAPLFEEYIEGGSGVLPPNNERPSFAGISRRDLATELRGLFSLAGIESQSFDENTPAFRDFLFCLIFLLESFQLNIGGRLHSFKVEYGHSISLSVMYESSMRPRNFADLTVLFLPNVNLRWGLFESKKLSEHIVRRVAGGCLAAISFTDDLVDGFTEREDLNKNRSKADAWPLPDPAQIKA